MYKRQDVVTVGVIAISFLILNLWAPYIYKYTSNVFYKYVILTKNTYTINDNLITQAFKDITFTIFASAGLVMLFVITTTVVSVSYTHL